MCWRYIFVCLVVCYNKALVKGVGVMPPEKLNSSLQIRLKNGLIQGSEQRFQTQTFYSFVGIPYAKPPLYQLRFKSPQQLSKWPYVLDATKTGPCCVGLNLTKLMANFEIEIQGEEDCLHLNIFVPKNPNNMDKNLPVMVFLYGGGFLAGCADIYGPDYFMKQNVILVIPNYRLSIFGHLNTEDLECPGNWAAKDHIAILKWIEVNIEAFGGNPGSVTIFGQSAGAVNVNALLLSPQAKGLFHKAIMMSGSSLSFWAYQTFPRKVAFDVGISLGIETNDSKILLRELRKIDSKTLIERHIPAVLVNMPQIMTEGLPLTPAVEPLHEEAVLIDYPYNILERGDYNKVPVICGVTNKEMEHFKQVYNMSPGSLIRFTKNHKNRTLAATEMLNHFLNTTDILSGPEDKLYELLSEESYYRPIHKTALLLAKHNPVYFYEFSYKGELGNNLLNYLNIPHGSNQGAVHSEDLAYLFTIQRKPNQTFNKKDLKIVNKLTKMYVNFATTGNPTPEKDPVLDNAIWPKATIETLPYMTIGNKLSAILQNFREKSFQFWENLYKKYSQKPYLVY